MTPRAERARRAFSAEYKLQTLAQYDALTSPAPKGAVTRVPVLLTPGSSGAKPGDAGALAGLAAVHRSGKRTPEQAEIERLRADKAKLARELAKTQAALEVMGKAHSLLELLSESADTDTPSSR